MKFPVMNNKDYCTHGPTRKPFTIEVFGKECSFLESDWCPDCLRRYLMRYSVPCFICEMPINPGQPVEIVGEKGDHFAHTTCGNNAAGYAGTWGEGVLIPHPTLERIARSLKR